jgi:hypothetical protein
VYEQPSLGNSWLCQAPFATVFLQLRVATLVVDSAYAPYSTTRLGFVKIVWLVGASLIK